MPVSKQEAIDAYGHFYVLCDTHDGTYTGRVYDEVTKYNWIGNLDVGWEPDTPPNLVIMEFLGAPRYQKDWNTGVLNGIPHSASHNSVFRVLEDAEKKVEEIKTHHATMYKELRKIGKKRELGFSTKTPDIKLAFKLLADEINLPDPQKSIKDTPLFVIHRDAVDRPLDIQETKILNATLHPVETNPQSSDPFSFHYELVVDFFAPHANGEKLTSTLITRTMTFDPKKSETNWMYGISGPRDWPSFPAGVHLYTSRSDAEKGVRRIAQRAYDNVRKYLPEPGGMA